MSSATSGRASVLNMDCHQLEPSSSPIPGSFTFLKRAARYMTERAMSLGQYCRQRVVRRESFTKFHATWNSSLAASASPARAEPRIFFTAWERGMYGCVTLN